MRHTGANRLQKTTLTYSAIATCVDPLTPPRSEMTLPLTAHFYTAMVPTFLAQSGIGQCIVEVCELSEPEPHLPPPLCGEERGSAGGRNLLRQLAMLIVSLDVRTY